MIYFQVTPKNIPALHKTKATNKAATPIDRGINRKFAGSFLRNSKSPTMRNIPVNNQNQGGVKRKPVSAIAKGKVGIVNNTSISLKCHNLNFEIGLLAFI
jgi:hypothetical protein